MNIQISGRHLEVTEAMRAYVLKKVGRLQKHYNRISELEVVVDGAGLQQKIEIIVKADNHQRFVVQHTAADAYACFDEALDKIERQLTRHKEKSRSRKGRVSAAEASLGALEAEGAEDSGREERA